MSGAAYKTAGSLAALLDLGVSLEKTAFGEREASKVLRLAKKITVRHPSAKGHTLSVRLPESNESRQTWLARGIDPGTTPFVNKIITSPRGDLITALRKLEERQLRQGLGVGQPPASYLSTPLTGPQRRMVEAVAKGHELDELALSTRKTPQLFRRMFNHVDPGVILREHNRVATLPSVQAPVQTFFQGMRAKSEAPLLEQATRTISGSGYTYGKGPRLSRHAIRRITPRMEELAGKAEEALWKTSALQGKEFAPGIPKSKPISRLPAITPQTMNRWTLAVQEHEAERAGKHFDLRLVDPDAGKAHSWAIPKARLPEPGEKLLAVQTFTHTPEYALHFGEKKPEMIGQGYGKGSVRMAVKEPTDIIEASNDHVRFNVYQGKNINEYLLRRTHDDKWLLHNVTATKDTAGVPQSRPKYKEMSPDKIDVTDDAQLMMAKIDGAHQLIKLDAGKPVRLFSYRPTERDTGVIEHTHRFVPGLTTKIPEHLDGLILRGELFAADPHTGQARQAVETGAVLNSNVWKSRDLQSHSPLRAAIFDVAKQNGKNVEHLPYTEKLDILKKVHEALPFLELPPMAETAKDKISLLNKIRTGQEPVTSEGVVLWPLAGGAPIKAKIIQDHDVFVREIFPEEGKREGLAGGFGYSWSPRGKIVGRVGTGFNHELKKDMLENPQKYIGRVAKVTAQDVYRDPQNMKKPGAIRNPSFSGFHLDKGLQPFDEKDK